MMAELNYGRLLYADGKVLYEGEMYNGKPYGKGVVYYPDGVKYQEGIFGIKGLNEGKEYYPNGRVRFEGIYRVIRAYGPNAPQEGKFFSKQGDLLFDGEFHLTFGGVGYPSVVEPKEYGPVVQDNAPRYHWIMYNDVK